MEPIHCASVGSGNIGTDLMIKILRNGRTLKLAATVGVDPASDGLARARKHGIATTHQGVNGLMAMDVFKTLSILFDATSAKAHLAHSAMLEGHDITLMDLTPAMTGPFCVPVVNLDRRVASRNVNMATCGGQATIPSKRSVSPRRGKRSSS